MNVPTATNGTEDIFCGAHTFLNGQQGRLVSMGGTNMYEFWQNSIAVGTATVFEFDNAPQPVWTKKVGLMNQLRYYNSCVRESLGDLVTFGNTGEVPGGGPSTADEFREEYDDVGDTWAQHAILPELGNQCLTVVNYPMATANYPDVHLLSTGSWLRVDTPLTSETAFFEKERCPNENPNIPERFVESIAGGPLPSPFGSSVHFLYLDDNNLRHEVVYAMGGSDEYTDCQEPTNYTSVVMKMTDPEIDITSWDDAAVPDLDSDCPRATHNAIILLDGSILVVGGAYYDTGLNTCRPVLNVDRYKTPEIFAPQVPAPVWEPMDTLHHGRTYHSVAALLPDGTVVSAGGVGATNDPAGGPQPEWHTIERFHPPYYFSPRPSITSHNAQEPVAYGSTFDVAVSGLTESGGEFRVALLAPCSGTHNTDFNQRYVELEWDPLTFMPSGGGATFKVTAPENGRVAPPGMYMMTVVDKDGIPSEAIWIWIGS